jgi:osmotically-inducible protein OsmY
MNKVLVAAISAAALIAGGCASHRSGESQGRTAGAVVDDAGITAKVKTAIARDAGAGTAASVNVTTYSGQVQLSGFVDSQEKADQAASAAKRVSGVQSVKNDIQVKSAASGR